MRLFFHRFPALGGLLFTLLCAAALAAPKYFHGNAATLTVTNTNDSGPGSLRQALVDVPDGGTIQFNPALYGQTITLTSAELVIDRNVNIDGPGQDLLAVSRSSSNPFRIIHVMPGRAVTIEGLTITNGSGTGGGVFNDHATLTLNSCSVENNFAPDQGGGIYCNGSGSSASLTVLNSVVRNNSVAPTPGPGGSLPTGGGISNNASGGSSTVTIDNSLVTGNVARAYWSSGIYLGAGGGVYNGANATLTITNSVVSNNTGGNDSQSRDHGGSSKNSRAGTIVDNRASNNHSMGPPLISGSAGYGGGIDNSNGGTLTITSTTLSGNSATFYGGALSGNGVITNCTISGNRAWSGFGGGIYGDPVVTNCTISGNQAWTGGGGIYGSPTITNSTISGNSAQYSGGGGIYGGGLVRHCTISGNTGSPGGGILAAAPLQIGNTILKTGASDANIAINGGTILSQGYNLSSDNGSGFLTGPGDQINTDPILGPLQDNGGPTFTHALLPGSPAIDTGDPHFIPPPLTDQRGYLRVNNGRIDIGSFEVQPGPTPTPSPSTAQLANISTRLRVETGDNIGIGGFIINGAGTLQVALRAIGPSLGQQGLPDFLPDPVLELRDSTGALLVQNDNWQDDPAAATQLTQLGLAPGDPTESALIVALPPGAYTAMVAGKNGGTGIGLVEVYNVDHSVPIGNIALVNISTRGFVQTGNNVMIGGFILTGASSEIAQVALRGIGPSLTQFGITNALADPTLELHDSNGALLISNDNWQDDQISAAQLTAHGLAPSNPNESGIFASLPPGLYTGILAGKNGGIGVGLVEVYNLN